LCTDLRALIGSLHKGCVEVVWLKHRIASFGVGPKKMTEHYAFIAVHSRHVNLGFYRGTLLHDTHARLEGTGRMLRHVSITSVDEIRAPGIAALLREAIAERKRHAAG
jgi:hypothetical protein